jgi:hypothetical protein
MARWTDLSPELREIILEKFFNLYNGDRHLRGVKERWEARNRGETPRRCIDVYASVSREWQTFIERKTFLNLTLTAPGTRNEFIEFPQDHDVAEFGMYVNGERRRYVKHIQLMVEVQRRRIILWGPDKAKENGVAFTKQVRNLLDQLSSWEAEGAGGLTFELGIHDGERGNDPPYVRYLNTGVVEVNELRVSRTLKLAMDHYNRSTSRGRFRELHRFRQEYSRVRREYSRSLSISLLDFLSDGDDQQHARQSLPQVEVITKLLVRLEYFRPISSKALVTLMGCFPRLESVHIEQWRRVGNMQDRWPSQGKSSLSPGPKGYPS